MNSNSNNNDSGGTDMREEALSDLAYSVGFSFVVLFVLVLVSYLSYRCNSNNNTSTQAPNYTTTNIETTAIFITPGLTEATLGTYPKFMYSQFKAQKGSDSIGSGCSICLVDYKDTDLIRALPECGHLYHLKCIDPWLKLHPSCPICRSSPTPTPLAEVVVPLASGQ